MIIVGKAVETFTVQTPLFCPYYNIWGRVEYWRDAAFRENPFTVYASSTSGSPVIIDARGRFFGFMDAERIEGSEFAFDGQQGLTVTVPEGQRLFVGEEDCGDDCWRTYNRVVMHELSYPDPADYPLHWKALEYCTWVEQKFQRAEGASPFTVLGDTFIRSYIDKVNELGYPRGKLTIDHGWTTGHHTYGDWEIHPERFPDFAGTIAMIRDAGFTPGLWMAPVWVHPESNIARRHPDWIGPTIAPSNPDSPVQKDAWHYFKPLPEVRDHLQTVFRRFYDMGVRKFKLDMTYYRKDYMLQLHRLFYQAFKEIDPDIEVEIHQGDIFFARYGDAIRTNDVLCNAGYRWRELAQAHFEVCTKSAPHKVINLDHIGGNDEQVAEPDFLEHLSLYEGRPGYPVVSLLPHHVGDRAVEQLGTYLDRYVANGEAVSRFC